jgi:hypothetical protein
MAMNKTTGDNDLMEELERLDRWLDGTDEGERPLDVLRAGGMVIPDASTLDDEALHGKLWELLEGMACIGMIVESTDHLSDRKLYEYLVTDALLEETMLGSSGAWHISPVRDDDSDIYLRYYADDETRAEWQRDFDHVLPPKEPRPYDRDRLLPGQRIEEEADA